MAHLVTAYGAVGSYVGLRYWLLDMEVVGGLVLVVEGLGDLIGMGYCLICWNNRYPTHKSSVGFAPTSPEYIRALSN